MVQLLLLVAGVVAGVRAALPLADVRALCPPASEAGHLGCVLDRAWLPALLKAVLVVAGVHAAGTLLLWTLPGAVEDRLDRRARAQRLVARRRSQAPVAAVERRAAPRVQLRLRVRISRGPGGPPMADVRTRDASISGLLLDPVPAVRVGETLWLTVHLGSGRSLSAYARVTRKTRDGAVGLEMEGLSAVDRGRLAACVASGHRPM